MSKESILEQFELFALGGEGIGGWLSETTDERVFQRLDQISDQPLTTVQLNQLLAFGHEAPVSDSFYRYYWLELPPAHPYDVSRLPDFDSNWGSQKAITSLSHLRWGLYRLFVDALLFFGNVRTGYRILRSLPSLDSELGSSPTIRMISLGAGWPKYTALTTSDYVRPRPFSAGHEPLASAMSVSEANR